MYSYIRRVHDLEGGAFLQYSVLMNAGTVSEGICPYYGLVGRHGEAHEMAHKPTGVHYFLRFDVGMGKVPDGEYMLLIENSRNEQIAHDLTIDRELSEAEVDAFVANNNFAIGPHLTESQVEAIVSASILSLEIAEIFGKLLEKFRRPGRQRLNGVSRAPWNPKPYVRRSGG